MTVSFGKLKHCGKDGNPCKCGFIWDVDNDTPVATVYSGNVGDDYPSIRINKDKGSILAVAEPYMEQITYWTVPQETADAYAMELVKRWNEYNSLRAKIEELKREIISARS